MTKNCMTIKEAAALTGLSTRALRYYEELGLLSPRRSEVGYRLYTEADAKQLARILAMRSCDLPLGTIKQICHSDTPDILPTLKDHLALLKKQKESTATAIERTQSAIAMLERMEPMDAKSSFEQLKEQGVARFEEEYGQEARELYGDEVIEASNERMMNLTKDEWDAKELLEEAIKVQLRLALASGNPASEAAQELIHMHKKWIAIHWGKEPSDEEYVGLAHGYLADSRFVDYYDSAASTGATEFLVEAIEHAVAWSGTTGT